MKGSDLIQNFKTLNVLVVGDLMLDRYLNGRVTRVSPEAPVPVVEWGGEETRLGGAANVALNIRAFGASVCLCGIVGQDIEGNQLLELMPNYHLEDSGIISSGERMTTVKTRVITGSQHLLRLDKEHTFDLTAKESDKLLERLCWLTESRYFDVMILQDYNKGVFSKTMISKLLALARARKIPVTVDPKIRNFWAYNGVALFKPNLKEVCRAVGRDVLPNMDALKAISKEIQEKLRNRITLITLSDAGVYIEENGVGAIFPAYRRNVADVCGAGDSVIAVVSLALAAGYDEKEMAILANLAGGQVVEKVGVVPINARQLEQDYGQYLATLAKT